MPDRKITDLVDGDPLQATDEFVVARAGDNFKIDGAAVVAAVTKHDVTISGNTAGALAAISSGTMTLAGGNNITLSQAGNAVTISALASSSLSATGIVSVSTNGNTISIGAPAFSGGMTTLGNTSGDTGYASQRLNIVGGNNITLSGSTDAGSMSLTISGPNVGGAQTGISGLANSETTYTSGTVSLSELGAITIRSTTGHQFQFSVNPQSVQPETQTFIAGISASDTLYTSGNVRISGSNAVTVKSGTGQLVVIDVPVQSTQVETQTFVGGIAGSNTTYTSGTVAITGVGGGVTVSSNTGQRIDISVAAQSVQPETQTFVAGISASDTLYTSGNVRISGSNAVTVKSGTGQLVVIDVPVQSTQPETQTFIGGISASDTLYTSGTVRITGVGGGVTVSSNTGQRIDISVAAQSVQPETQTFIAGISASDTLYTSGNVRFTGVGGGVTVSSNTGQRVDISVAAQSVQPETQTFIGGISASDTLYTSGSVRFTGSNAVTVKSGTGQLVVIDVPTQTTQVETQTFLSGIIASDTTYTSGNVRFTGVGGGITVSSNTGQRVDLSVAAQSVQPETQTFVAGIQNSQTTYTSGTVNLSVVAGNLTIRSTTGQAFQFSMSQTVQAETQTAVSGIANSQTTYTSGTVSLSELGAITIRSTTGNQFQFSVNSQSVQAETQTFVGGIGNSQTTYTSGTVNLSVVAGQLTIRSTTGNAFQFSASQSVQAETQTAVSGIANSQTTYTSGTVSLSELGAITIRSTTGNQFQLSVNSQSVQAETQTFVGGIGNSQTTYTSGTVNLSVVAGQLTIRSTTGNAFQFSASQSVQAETQTAISGLANSQTTYTSGTVSLSELGAITIRSTTGNQFQFSVNSQTVQTQNFVALSATNTLYSSGTVLLTGSNLITVKSSAAGQTIILDATNQNLSVGLSNIGNTSGDTTVNTGSRFVLAGGNNITLSASTAAGATTITVSAPNLGAGAMSVGVSTGGNTQGNTGITGTRLVLVGTNNITLSQNTDANGGTISISGPAAGGFSAGMSTEGNTAGATGVTGTRMVLVGSGVVSLSQTTGAAGGTVSILAPATSSLSATGGIQISTNGSTISIGDGGLTAAYWENMPAMEGVLYTHVSGVSKTPFYWNENLPQGIKPANIAMRVSMVTASADLSLSVHFGIYTFVNSTSAALLGSGSDAFVVSNGSSVSFSGQRNLVLTSPGTVAAISNLSGGNYLFGCMFSATATGAMNASVYAASAAAGPRLGRIMPGTNQLSTATSQGIAGLYGRGSTTVNAMPANVVASDVVNQGIGASSPMKPYIFIRS